MKLTTYFLFLAVLISSNFLSAQVSNERSFPNNKLTVLRDNVSNFEFESILSDFTISDVVTANGNFSRILAGDEYIFSGKAGCPELPVIQRMIEIPADAEISIEVLKDVAVEYFLSGYGNNNKLYPVQPSVIKSKQPGAFQLNNKIYSSDSYFSDKLITITKLGYLRGTQMARLTISPFEYNPVQNKIQVHKNIRIRISFKNANIEKTLFEKSRTRSIYHQYSTKGLLNKNNTLMRFDTIVNKPMKYVIVSPPLFKETLQPFIQWKMQKGFDVITAYTDDPLVGTSKESIKRYLENLYTSATPENPAPVFILLVGDTPQIPTFTALSDGESYATDLYYAEYTGDFFPELFYGRFSAREVTQLKSIIDKTIEYEKYEMPNTSYLNEVLLVAGKQSGDYATIPTNGFVNYMKTNYFSVNPLVDTSLYYNGTSHNYTTEIINKINQGKSFVGYTAHCDATGWYSPAFNTTQAKNLTNSHKYFFSINNCCLSNKYNETECFGEALLRAVDAGAIGVIGASKETLWDEDYYWEVGSKNAITLNPPYNATQLGAFDRFFHTHNESINDWYTTQGEMVQAGNMAVTQSGSEYEQYYWEIYNLLGDPSLTPYVGLPSDISLSIPDSIEKGISQLTFQATPFSYVALYKDSVLLGAGFSDNNGQITVTINTPVTTNGYIRVTATKQFCKPVIDSVRIFSPLTPKVILLSYQLTDSVGSVIEKLHGEQLVKFNLTLQNIGMQSELNPITTIQDVGNNFTLINDTYLWTTIASGDSVQQHVFELRANRGIEDLLRISLKIKITGNNNYEYEKDITLIATAPYLTTTTTCSNESLPQTNIIVTVKNTGSYLAENVYCKLKNNSENILIPNDSILFIGTLLPNQESSVSFSTSILSDIDTTTYIIANTSTYSDGGYKTGKSTTLYLQNFKETFETGNFSEFAWDTTSSLSWRIDANASNAYQGNYSARSREIDNSKSSVLAITRSVSCNDSIKFAVKVSSEVNYDILEFYIDNTLTQSWSGNVAWQVVSFPVIAGSHTFKWIYKKDNSNVSGSDAAWIDEIVFPRNSEEKNIRINPITQAPLSLHLYPNPADKVINLEFENLFVANCIIEIYNSLGVRVSSSKTTLTTISEKQTVGVNTSNYSSGIYYMIIYIGNEIINRKFIVAH